jgi:hypothetical protein
VKLEEVYQLLEDIKLTEGKGAVNKKMEMLSSIIDKMNFI